MAPSGRRSTRKPRSRRTQWKKKIEEEEANSEDLVAESNNTFSKTSSCNMDGDHGVVVDDVPSSTSGCSTPKGQRFQIPEILTCPPAPKKPRNLSNCLLLRRRSRRTPIPFFASPDIELFFFLALRNIPAVL